MRNFQIVFEIWPLWAILLTVYVRASVRWAYASFYGKCFPSTCKKYSHRYQVPAETERFVWLARDHTLYPGFWSKRKLPLNKITSGDVQQAKQWTRKFSLPLATKLSLITVCKGWVVSTRSIVFPTSALKNVHVVTRKLDQTSVAPTNAEKIW